MSSKDTELLSQLELAVSREEGLKLLRSNLHRVSDELSKMLSARAEEFQLAGETVLSEDFSAWAAETRSLVTRRLAMSAESMEAEVKFLQTQRSRFDDASYDLCFRIASERVREVHTLLEAPEESKTVAAAVAEALEGAARDVDFLMVIGKIVSNSRYEAQASLLLRTLLLFRSQWEAQQGRKPERSGAGRGCCRGICAGAVGAAMVPRA